MLNVTKTFLPPQEEYQAILKKAWDTGWMTNRGVLVKELEQKLKDRLKVSNIIAMTNGTLPMQIAIKALGLKGEIITTPFSYVATTSSIVWEGCIPVFVDIEPDFLTIDAAKIEAAITSRTTAILATHVFGNPCDVDRIDAIAKKHNLKVIYDAAHCFGVTYKGKSIFNYGDVSTCSFHATKLFHTGEGGALFCKEEYFDRMYYHHNFGHDGPDTFKGIGTNAKMSEPQAAMGLAVLPYMDSVISARANAIGYYLSEILRLQIPVRTFRIRDETKINHHYFPVIFTSEKRLLEVKAALEKENINARRYFYPSLNLMEYVDTASCPISEEISARILCLPLSSEIVKEDQNRVLNVLNSLLNV